MELIKFDVKITDQITPDYQIIASFDIPKIDITKYILIDLKIFFISKKVRIVLR